MKFLVIRFSSIGDIVLTTTAIRCLKQQIPDAEVHFLSKLAFKAVTEANPHIDKFFYLNNDLGTIITTLKKEKYDYIIDLHNNFRTLQIKLALGCKHLTYNKETFSKFLLTKFGINTMRGRHIADRCLDTLMSLGVVNDGKGLDYFISEKDVVPITDLPAQHRFGFIAVIIGASYFTKKMPVQKLQALCIGITYPIVLIGGKEDIDVGNQIASVDTIKIYNACGKFRLNESADLVRQAKVVISHDTGLQYIACAFNKKVLAIWGGTSPKLDVEPYYGSNNFLPANPMYHNYIVPNLPCQPCSNFGTKTCPKKHFKCMMLQDVEAIAVKALLMI